MKKTSMRFQVVGPRRSGKSSLVKHLRDMGYDAFETRDDEETPATFEEGVPKSAPVWTHHRENEEPLRFVHAERYWQMHEREKGKEGDWMRVVLDAAFAAASKL